MEMNIQSLVQQWNDTRKQLAELRKNQMELQSTFDAMSKKLQQYLREHPEKQFQIGSTRIYAREVNVYPHFSQQYIGKVLMELLSAKEGERVWKDILAYRKSQVRKVWELHTKSIK